MPKPNIEPYNLRKWATILDCPDLIFRGEPTMNPGDILKKFEEKAVGGKPFYEFNGFKYYAVDTKDHMTRFTPLKNLDDIKVQMEFYSIVIENTNEPSIGSCFQERQIQVISDSDDLHFINTSLVEHLEDLCIKTYGGDRYPAIMYIMYFDRRFKDKLGLPHVFLVYDNSLGFFADGINLYKYHSGKWAGLVEDFMDDSLSRFALEYYWRFTRDKEPVNPAEYYWKLYNIVLMTVALNLVACAAEEYNIELLPRVLETVWSHRFKDERALAEATTEEVIKKTGVNVNDVSDMFVGYDDKFDK